MPQELQIILDKAAIVAVDLQQGIATPQVVPNSAKDVVENTTKLLDVFRKNNMPVFLVHATPSPDLKDALHPVSETSFQMRSFDPAFSEFMPELNIQPNDFIIAKHQWGAFYGTELDLQLWRRRIDTIVLCGISTNIGVESTARFAYELGYNQILVEDAMSAFVKEGHEASIKYVFPRLGLIRTTNEVLTAINSAKSD
ncbi:MAG: isochorismatase family protein [Ignavibacteriaceae bacterium]|nr:isochorismatase family protein [Ignavibacteriaceae bacterium]